MRWIDIDLTAQDEPSELASLLAEVESCVAEMPDLQNSAGMDSPLVVRRMAEIGQMLFHAIMLGDPEGFQEHRDRDGGATPNVGVTEADFLTGYHLMVPSRHVGLPWTWLHNGLEFLLERYTICASSHESRLPTTSPMPPWMTRFREANLTQQVQGERPLRHTLSRLRPKECADPEILFVPGHCEDTIRQLIYREADGIKRALEGGSVGRPLARLSVLVETVTPTLLTRRSAMYQGLHFAGPTAQPLDWPGNDEAAWLTGLVDAAYQEPGTVMDADYAVANEDLPIDLEPEVVGVDPITTLLDAVTAKSEASGGYALPPMPPAAATATMARTPWWLDDGPVQPEELGQKGGLPPLVFSNSYCSLPAMGARFLTAGASTFVGPYVPLYSRPARKFAGRFYNFLADGHCAASALRTTALACRAQFGPEHPVWLSYGVAGYGSLALQYL